MISYEDIINDITSKINSAVYLNNKNNYEGFKKELGGYFNFKDENNIKILFDKLKEMYN